MINMPSCRGTLQLLALLGVLVLVALALLTTSSASARTITVDNRGEGDHTKIQLAIDEAEIGDTIRVNNGSYYGDIVIDKSISLIGNGSTNTTIDGGLCGDTVMITADNVVFTGFRVIHRYYFDTYNNGMRMTYNAGVNMGTDNNVVSDINCSSNDRGMILQSASHNTITNSSFTRNKECGIYLAYKSSRNFIAHNEFSLNEVSGISISVANNNTIMNNTFSNAGKRGYGILVGGSYHTQISGNKFTNTWRGLTLISSYHTVITENTMVGCGIELNGKLEHWDTHSIDTTNTVDGRPVYYIKDRTREIVPAGGGEVILVNCTYMTISNQDFSNSSVGIVLGFSSYNTIVNSSFLENSRCGVHLLYSHWNTLSNNTYEYNNQGVSLRKSEGNVISDSSFLNNSYGIEVSMSHENIVRDSLFSNREAGIWVNSTSTENLITNCSFDSHKNGIIINADNNAVENCTIRDSKESGIWINNRIKNMISHCSFINNTEYGIKIEYGYGTKNTNTLEGNYFEGNGKGETYIYEGARKPRWQSEVGEEYEVFLLFFVCFIGFYPPFLIILALLHKKLYVHK